jgi:hypothetical protein
MEQVPSELRRLFPTMSSGISQVIRCTQFVLTWNCQAGTLQLSLSSARGAIHGQFSGAGASSDKRAFGPAAKSARPRVLRHSGTAFQPAHLLYWTVIEKDFDRIDRIVRAKSRSYCRWCVLATTYERFSGECPAPRNSLPPCFIVGAYGRWKPYDCVSRISTSP